MGPQPPALRGPHGTQPVELVTRAAQPRRGPRQRLAGLVRANHGTWRGWVRHQLAQADYLLGLLDRWTAPDWPQVRRLVFVCLGNINRSAFASAVAQQLGEPSISIGLATTTGAPAFPQAIAQARRQGIDLSAHTATDIHDYVYTEGDLLLVMEVRHVHRLRGQGIPDHAIALLGAWSSPRRIHLHDPHTLSEEYFETCFTLIESAVRRLLAERGVHAR